MRPPEGFGDGIRFVDDDACPSALADSRTSSERRRTAPNRPVAGTAHGTTLDAMVW